MAKYKRIHSSIKKALGFEENMPDKEFRKAWKRKSTLVCKPCWELKYCPYGPFVEQSPLLPSLKSEAAEQNEYFKKCLASNTMGSVVTLGENEIRKGKKRLEIFKEFPHFLLSDIFEDIDNEELIKEGVEKNQDLFDLIQTPLKDFETYQVPFPLDESEDERAEKVLEEIKKVKITPDLQKRIDSKIKYLENAIETGVDDYRKELDPLRRKFFQKAVDEFEPEKHPDFIPKDIAELSCNIFGHICPVVFVGESITETTEKRRKGRYISFKTKIRVVRRDNHTCQKCSKHLKDDEVEFDHIIPISKGGSSEEHNIRLTCFDCNRDKSDKMEI